MAEAPERADTSSADPAASNYEQKLKALHSHASAITQASNIEEISRVTLDTIDGVIGPHLLTFMMPREEGLIAVANRRGLSLGRPLPLDGRGITVKAKREKRSILVNDTTRDTDYVKGSTDNRSELAVPVIVDGEAVAVINLESLRPNAFTKQDQILVEIIADHIASAMKKLHLIESERRTKTRLEALHRHAFELSSLHDIKQIATFSMTIINDILGHRRGGFAMVEGDRLTYIHTPGLDASTLPELHLNGGGITVRAVKTGKTQHIGDTRLDSDYLPDLNGTTNVSELDVPINVDGAAVGVINLESAEPNAYGDEDRHIIEILSEHVALAIKNLRLLENERRNAEKLDSLNVSAAALARSVGAQEAIDTACRILSENFGYQWVGVGRVDADAIKYVGYAGVNLSGNDTISLTRRTVTVRAVETGEVQLVADTTRDPSYVVLAPAERPYRSELVVPIKTRGRVSYVINIESLEVNAFPKQDVRLVELLALNLGTAFELIRERESLAALHKHAPLIAMAKDVPEIAQIVHDTVKGVLGFPIAGFHHVRGGLIELVFVPGFTVNGSFTQTLDGSGLIPQAIREGRSILVEDVRLDPHYVAGPIGEEVRLSELVIPVKVGARCVGAINLEDGRTSAFTAGDQRMMELLALHVGTALELMEEKRQLQEKQMNETRELLEGANRISGMVRHDLKGPLQSIKNATYLAEQHPDKAKEMLDAIDRSVDYATKMLDDLRSSTSPIKLAKAVVNVNDLVDQSLQQASIPDDIALKREYAEGFIAASLDATRIRRAVDNLVKNAVEAMPRGGTLTVSIRKEGEVLEIAVTDTGIGISPESQENLFRPFYTTKPRGTGLGLAVCKQAVEAHGGSIAVASREGAGSTFTIRLPLKG